MQSTDTLEEGQFPHLKNIILVPEQLSICNTINAGFFTQGINDLEQF